MLFVNGETVDDIYSTNSCFFPIIVSYIKLIRTDTTL